MVKPCLVADVLAQTELLAEYAAESGMSGMPKPEAHRSSYQNLEDAGVLQALGYYKDYEMLGFVVVLVNLIPHYSAAIGLTESIFVTKQHRNTGAGLLLLRAAEKHAASKGAIGFIASAPVGSSLARVLPCIGYAHTNEAFFKALHA